jgi:hypothetical protein
MDAELKLGSKVKIKETGVVGKIVGIWHTIHDNPLYHVQYPTTNQEMVQTWLYEEDLELLPPE